MLHLSEFQLPWSLNKARAPSDREPIKSLVVVKSTLSVSAVDDGCEPHAEPSDVRKEEDRSDPAKETASL